MKTLLICLALLLGLSDGSVLVFPGCPLVVVTPEMLTIDEIPFPISSVKALRYVPDNLVM